MKDEISDFIDRIKYEQRNVLEELCECFDAMAQNKLYSEMIPILKNIKETAPDVYYAYYHKTVRAEEQQKRIDEVY